MVVIDKHIDKLVLGLVVGPNKFTLSAELDKGRETLNPNIGTRWLRFSYLVILDSGFLEPVGM